MIVKLVAYSSYMLLIQTLLPIPWTVVGLKVTPTVGDYENQLTRAPTEQDYWMQKAIEDELLDDLTALLDREGYPEGQMSHYYAKKLRNNAIGNDAFLDRSVEMTSRQKGVMKKKSYSTWVPSCSCESTKQIIFLGEDFSPMGIESLSCSGNCVPPYECKPHYYSVPVLRKVAGTAAAPHWEPHRVNITTSCVCVADSDDPNYGGTN